MPRMLLIYLMGILLLFTTTVANSAPTSRAELRALIDRLAQSYAVDSDLVHAIVRAESAYDPAAISSAGAIGLMQVMPATAADYGITSKDALFDPQTNVRVGIRHLKRLLARYPLGQAVMAYNAGEGALERHQGSVPFAETQRYTYLVLTDYLRRKNIAPFSPQARKVTGITLSPAMARGMSAPQRVDRSTLSLQLPQPLLRDNPLARQGGNSSAQAFGPASRPLFESRP